MPVTPGKRLFIYKVIKMSINIASYKRQKVIYIYIFKKKNKKKIGAWIFNLLRWQIIIIINK